jgi:hypothetical protein
MSSTKCVAVVGGALGGAAAATGKYIGGSAAAAVSVKAGTRLCAVFSSILAKQGAANKKKV